MALQNVNLFGYSSDSFTELNWYKGRARRRFIFSFLHNPIVKSNRILTLDEIDEEIFKSFKMKGLLVDDANVIKLMDQTLESGKSKIVSAEIKKDGTLSSRSQVASEEDFKLMSRM